MGYSNPLSTAIKKSYIIPPRESPPQFFTEKLKDQKKCKKGRAGWVHSNLDVTRRLRELKSEFVESFPIKISPSPPLHIEARYAEHS